MKMKLAATSLVAALALSLAACGGDDSSGGGSVESWCALEDSFETTPLDDADLSDPDAFSAAVDEFREQFDQIRDAAPSEISEDVNTVLGAFDDLFTALEEANYDFTQLDAETIALLEDADIEAANDRITEFSEQNCGA